MPATPKKKSAATNAKNSIPVKKAKAPAAKKAPTAAPKAAKAKAPAAGPRELMNPAQLTQCIESLADAIEREFPSPAGLMLLGIRTRGAVVADRLKAILTRRYRQQVASGVLDITFYRDDLSRHGPNPMVRNSDIPFDVQDASIVLVDDVLYTGRTIRAALEEIADFGRPALVRLAIVVDRGLREYPIQADYVGLKLETTQDEVVHVMLEETDERNAVILEKRVR